MKKTIYAIAAIVNSVLFVTIIVCAITAVVFLLQGNFAEAAQSFYKVIGALLGVVFVSVVWGQIK